MTMTMVMMMMVTMTTTRLLVEITDTLLLHLFLNPLDFRFYNELRLIALLWYCPSPARHICTPHPPRLLLDILHRVSPITAINVGKFSRAPTRQEKARNVNTNVTESLKCQIVMHQI